MSKENTTIKTLFFIVLMVCCLAIVMLFYVPKRVPMQRPVPSSDNEKFLVLQQKYIHNLERKITHLLEPMVGKGKVYVAVQLDLNLKNARLGHHTQTINPDTKDPNVQITSFTNTSEKQIQNLIQQQHISVIIDGNTRKGDNGIYQPRTAQEIATYKRLIQSAVGYNSIRGDTLEIQNHPFVAPIHTRKIPCSLLGIAMFLFVLGISFVLLAFCFCYKNSAHRDSKKTEFSADLLNQINNNPARAIAVIKNWMYVPADKKSTDWAPIQKVGIVLLALDENIVRQILIALDDNEIRQVAKTMTTLGVIPPQESSRILTELYDAMQKGSAVVGNPTRVQQILAESPKEETLKFKETLQTPHSSLWQELSDTDPTLLIPRLLSLRPEIVAYILYRLPTSKASNIIQNFPEKKASQILIHLSHIGHISASTNTKMEQEAIQATKDILDTLHTPSGSDKTSDILTQLAQTETGQAVIQELNEKEPFLIRKMTAKLVHFEDLAHWPSTTIQTILRNTPKTTALMALANASKDIKKTIQRNVPPTLWAQLEPEINTLEAKASPTDVASARQAIVDIVRTLVAQGKIQL